MQNKWTDSPQRLLGLIIVLGVLIRVGTSIFFFGNDVQSLPGTFDEISYHNLALRVMDGYGFSFGEAWWPGTPANEPTAHWSYSYTSFLIGVYSIFGRHPLAARIIQSILTGILMPLITYRLAGRIFSDIKNKNQVQTIALLAAAISAVYVYFFYYSAALITETFYILGILWTFEAAVKIVQTEKAAVRQWIMLGVALAFTVLLRQLFLLFAPFMLLWIWWAKRPSLWKLAVPLLVTFLFMAPWTYRNYQVFDTLVPLNTNSGHAFFWGNHPRYGTQFEPILPTPQYYAMIPQELKEQGLNEAEMDSALLKLGLGFVQDDPGRYLLLSLSRIPPYFKFWPSGESGFISNLSRVGSFGLFLPFIVAGLYLSLRQQFDTWRARLASPFTLLYLFIVVYAGMHILTWTLIRYRVPIDAIFILFAGFAVNHALVFIQSHRKQAFSSISQTNV